MSLLLSVPQCCLSQLASICKETKPNSVNCWRMLRMVHREQKDLRQSFLKYPTSSLGITARHSSGTRNTHGLTMNEDNPVLLAVSGSWNSFASVKEFTLSCNSWIWTINWFTAEGLSSFCVEGSSYFNCRALSASAQQILRNSSVSWQSLARSSWKALFLFSNSSHSQPFSLWGWSDNGCAWYRFHPPGWSCIPISQRAISACRIFQSVLSKSDCASDNLDWAAKSPWKHDQLSFQGSHEYHFFGQNSFPFHLRILLTLQFSISLPFDNNFSNLENGSTPSLAFSTLENGSTSCLDFSTFECVWEQETQNGLALTSRSWKNSGEVSCPISVVVNFRCIHSGREVVKVVVETALSRK